MQQSPIIAAVADDSTARRYLEAVAPAADLPEALLPPRKWVQALYLTDAGRLPVAAPRLARLLDVSHDVAQQVHQRLGRLGGTVSVVLAATLALAGLLLELVGIGLEAGLVRIV